MKDSTVPFHCGMNFGFKAPRGYFASAEGMAQPERMAALHIDCVALIVSVYMDHCASTEEIVESLQPHVRELRDLCAACAKPLALLETVRRSTRGLKGNAYDFTHPGVYDAEIQGRYMEGLALAFQGEPWYRGSFWWKWDEHQKEQRAHYYTDPAGDQGFTIAGKPATETLKQLYAQ